MIKKGMIELKMYQILLKNITKTPQFDITSQSTNVGNNLDDRIDILQYHITN